MTEDGSFSYERPASRPLTRGEALRMRWKRRRLLWRAFRGRHAVRAVADRTAAIRPGRILVVMTVRNEALRLPYFLDYYRRLGAGHFLIVDNCSDDGTAGMLAAEPDVSLWQATGSYHDSRFGLDWMGWLLIRYGHGHWCLMLDADELLVYPGCEGHDLHDLTAALDRAGQPAMGAMMLDLFPRGPLEAAVCRPGQDPLEVLTHFDPGPFHAVRQYPAGNLWLQGGTRERAFFADAPRRAPTLNKLPLVRWNRRYVHMNSCHSLLPPRLNFCYDGPVAEQDGTRPSGLLLHTKFLSDASVRAVSEKARAQHFARPRDYDGYYDALAEGPRLWHEGALQWQGSDAAEALGLMRRASFGEDGRRAGEATSARGICT